MEGMKFTKCNSWIWQEKGTPNKETEKNISSIYYDISKMQRSTLKREGFLKLYKFLKMDLEIHLFPREEPQEWNSLLFRLEDWLKT